MRRRDASLWLLLVATTSMGAGCRQKQPEFFRLADRTRAECSPRQNAAPFCVKNETFVIAHGPTRPEALLRAVQAFNERTLADEELAKWGRYNRTFYRESSKTPRDFQGNEQDWGGDSLDHHAEDLAISTDFFGSRKAPHVRLWRHGRPQEPPRI
jgi:hypothetical protein